MEYGLTKPCVHLHTHVRLDERQLHVSFFLFHIVGAQKAAQILSLNVCGRESIGCFMSHSLVVSVFLQWVDGGMNHLDRGWGIGERVAWLRDVGLRQERRKTILYLWLLDNAHHCTAMSVSLCYLHYAVRNITHTPQTARTD